MRYLGQIGVAAQVASRASSDTRATTGRNAEDVPEEPGLPEERAMAWRAWAGTGTAPGRAPRLRQESASVPLATITAPRVQIREQEPGERDRGLTTLDGMSFSTSVPARRRFVEWIVQIVEFADPAAVGADPEVAPDGGVSCDQQGQRCGG